MEKQAKNLIALFFSLLAICACAMLLSWTGGCGGVQQKGEPKIVAIIGDRQISSDMLDKYFYENLNGVFSLALFKDFEQDQHDIDRVKSRLFEDFLDTELLLGEAIKAGVTVSDQEVQRFLNEFGEDAAAREKARRGSSDMIRDFLIIQKFKSEKLFPNVGVDEQEVKRYYDRLAQESRSEQRVALSIIQLETSREAKDLLNKIKKGEARFEEIAGKYSADTNMQVLHTYDLKDLPDDIRVEVKKLQIGQVSDVVPLLDRFCIFRIEKLEKAGMKSFEEIEGGLKERLLREKSHAMFEEYMKELKSRTHIKILFENLPFHFVQEAS